MAALVDVGWAGPSLAWALGRSIAVVGALLVITFVVIEPDASQGLGVAARAVFWTIHVGLGLAALYAASWLVLPRVMSSLPAWLALLVAGTGGALLLAPAGYLVDEMLPARVAGHATSGKQVPPPAEAPRSDRAPSLSSPPLHSSPARDSAQRRE